MHFSRINIKWFNEFYECINAVLNVEKYILHFLWWYLIELNYLVGKMVHFNIDANHARLCIDGPHGMVYSMHKFTHPTKHFNRSKIDNGDWEPPLSMERSLHAYYQRLSLNRIMYINHVAIICNILLNVNPLFNSAFK